MPINSCNTNGLVSLSTMIISPTTALALASTPKLDYWGKGIAKVRANSISLFSSGRSLNRVRLFATAWTATFQTSLSITNSWSLLKLVFIESVMPSNHLILYHPLLLLPSSFLASGSFPMSHFFPSGGQSIGVSASTSVLPMNIQD